MSDNSKPSTPAFAATLETWGDAPALIDADGGVLTYLELAARADAFAARLGQDVRLIAIEMRNALEPVVAYLGALRAGVPTMLHAGGPAALNIATACPADATFTLSANRRGWTLEQTSTAWELPPHPDLAVLLSTSGSTGSAKFVKLSGSNLQTNAKAIEIFLDLTPRERAICNLPLCYAYGLSVLNSHLSAGASVVLTEESVAAAQFRRIVADHRATSLAGVPYGYELMERSGLLANLPGSVRTLTQAGGRMAAEAVARVAGLATQQGARLIVMYGQTEATARIAYLDHSNLGRRSDCIGRAIPGGELWIENPDGKRLRPGHEGELVYRGANVMMGYAICRSDLAAGAGCDVLRTGDLAVEVEPGLFRISGRQSRFVKPLGLRINLDEFEARCREAGVPACITGDDELVVVAWETGSTAGVQRVIHDLGLPQDLFVLFELETIPRLPGGKVDYLELMRLGRTRRAVEYAATGFVAVEALFRRMARGESIVETVSFEQLGGDSLTYVQCAIAIESALGRLPDDWERMSLSALRALHRNTPDQPGKRRFLSLEVDVVVRSLAILQVLLQHGINGIAGGADILMLLAGLSWARFQRPRLLRGNSRSALTDFARRYLVIYALIVAAVFALNGEIDVRRLIFVSTFAGAWGGVLNTYWFIESLTWCVGLLCAMLSVPAMRRLFDTRPVASALGFVGAALFLRLIGAQLLDAHAHAYRSPDQMLLYFAAGWAFAFSGKVLRFALLALVLVASSLAWGMTNSHVTSLAFAGLALMAFQRVRVPRLLGRAITIVAAASFYIYLLNPGPMYLTDQILHARFGRYWWLQVSASLALGIGAHCALGWLERRADDGLCRKTLIRRAVVRS